MSRREWYEAYLRSPHWKIISKRKRKQKGYRCENCGSRRGPLDVHHKTYKRVGKERMSDLQVLCRTCHQNKHRGMWGRIRNLARKVRRK